MLLVQAGIAGDWDSIAEVPFDMRTDLLNMGSMAAGLIHRCAKAEGVTTEEFMADLGLRAAVLADRAERKS